MHCSAHYDASVAIAPKEYANVQIEMIRFYIVNAYFVGRLQIHFVGRLQIHFVAFDSRSISVLCLVNTAKNIYSSSPKN